MIRLKVNPFIALLLSAILVGLLNKMPLPLIVNSINTGIGDTVGGLALIITFGAMLGKIMEISGAAYRITNVVVRRLGRSKIKYAILITGFIIGLPMMYNASFLVLIPIIYALSFASKIKLIQLGIPLSASLSIAHGYLPPHPAPVAVSQMYNADMNVVFLYGLLFSVPAILFAGILLPKFFRNVNATVPANLYNPIEFSEEGAPSFSKSLFCAILPFILMASAAVFRPLNIPLLDFLGDPSIALFIAVLFGIYFLGIQGGRFRMEEIMKHLGTAVASIAMIILIIAAGGAFKQVLQDSGSAEYIMEYANGVSLHPILLAWGLAAIIRLLLGSATVATITAAGIMTTMVQGSGVSMEIMVLATGSGSLMFSHFNDIGFWMFKEYYNVSIKQTFMIWTTMECIVGIVGLIGCFILNALL